MLSWYIHYERRSGRCPLGFPASASRFWGDPGREQKTIQQARDKMGAVCMEKQMKKKGEKGKAKDKRVKQEELLKGDSGQELEAILGSLPRKELENLLLSAAEENESFRNRLLVRYGQADEGLIQDLEKELRGIRKGYSYGRKKSGYGEKEDFFMICRNSCMTRYIL